MHYKSGNMIYNPWLLSILFHSSTFIVLRSKWLIDKTEEERFTYNQRFLFHYGWRVLASNWSPEYVGSQLSPNYRKFQMVMRSSLPWWKPQLFNPCEPSTSRISSFCIHCYRKEKKTLEIIRAFYVSDRIKMKKIVSDYFRHIPVWTHNVQKVNRAHSLDCILQIIIISSTSCCK